jgi:PhnB protein
MHLIPYLGFNGQCEAAFKFYDQVLGGKIVTMLTYGDSPMADHVSSEWHTKILHASLIVGDTTWLMGADTPPGHHEEAKGFSVSVGIEDPAEAERIFQALAENGAVRMPIQQTFWSIRFGMVVDQFGIPWMINCERAA